MAALRRRRLWRQVPSASPTTARSWKAASTRRVWIFPFRHARAEGRRGNSVAAVGDAVHFSCMSPHSLLDRRALEMDRIVARRLDENPDAVLGRARKNLERWLGRCDASVRPVLMEWKEILERPPERVREVLLGEDCESARLRQSSPFCGILTPQERTGILMRFR